MSRIRPSSALPVSLLSGALLLGACVSHTGGLPTQWRGSGPPAITAPPGDCPALAGVWRSDGHDATTEARPAVLQQVLGQQLGLTELMAADGTHDASVAFTRDGEGWQAKDAHGAAQIPVDGRAIALDPNGSANGSRIAGCADGRLWIGFSSVRPQYESLTQTRALGVISTAPDGALQIEIRTERRHYGLLPSPSVQRLTARYSFAPATSGASPASSASPP
ncbi:hypothetical protein [Brevundimonas diminuta]|uniref:hypothetical protein n=1 Tax=Brevundimonas diminuta TaxID=293 RepID=UPI003208FF18